jgi:S1-C subfamily serine protease
MGRSSAIHRLAWFRNGCDGAVLPPRTYEIRHENKCPKALLPPISGAIPFSQTGKTMKKTIPLLACALALVACVSSDPINLESRAISVDPNAEPVAGAAADASEVQHLLPSIGPTYVTLNVSTSDAVPNGRDTGTTAIASGSGYVVDASGLVMTAAHVAVRKGNKIAARAANGRIYSGDVIAINPGNDMAIIKLRGYNGVAAQPASPGCVAQGGLVFTLGRPHDQGDTARVGRLDSYHFGRAVAYGKFGYPDALVLHMGTQRGESGGPLFDGKGQLIGMVVSTLTDADGNLINQAHAIPAPALAKFLCSSTQCSPAWAALAMTPSDSCTGT